MARPFSYLLICDSYPPVLGGSEIEAQRVSTELRKRGHVAQIVCSGGPPMPPVANWIDPFGNRVRILGGRWPKRLRGRIFALGVAWTLFTQRRNYEVAYFLMQGLQLATGLPVARLLGKPIVMKFSCSGQVAGMTASWLSRLELGFLRRWATSILVLNPGMKQEAQEVGFDLERVGWMPNPVDTTEFQPCSPERRAQIRAEYGVAPDAPVVVFVGRLEPQKKLHWLVPAFARVVKRQPNAILVLIGDGSLRPEITRLAQDLGIDRNVRFAGRLDKTDVLKWLQAGDIFTLISAVEGLPCSLIEAMSAGMAPVVSDIPAHSQLIDHEVHGLLTELGNEEAVERGLLRVIQDPDLRARLGAAARRRMVDEYSTSQVVTRYETLFTRVLASPRFGG